MSSAVNITNLELNEIYTEIHTRKIIVKIPIIFPIFRFLKIQFNRKLMIRPASKKVSMVANFAIGILLLKKENTAGIVDIAAITKPITRPTKNENTSVSNMQNISLHLFFLYYLPLYQGLNIY